MFVLKSTYLRLEKEHEKLRNHYWGVHRDRDYWHTRWSTNRITDGTRIFSLEQEVEALKTRLQQEKDALKTEREFNEQVIQHLRDEIEVLNEDKENLKTRLKQEREVSSKHLMGAQRLNDMMRQQLAQVKDALSLALRGQP